MIEPTSFSHGVRDDHAIVPDLGQVDPFGGRAGMGLGQDRDQGLASDHGDLPPAAA
ncbi:MAG TPA: hypothetical protein VM367_06420 [Pseudonocardia sp.]|jgi:hypothetical protein|nr:hypothetical protein [Pseudonocardia sp.]